MSHVLAGIVAFPLKPWMPGKEEETENGMPPIGMSPALVRAVTEEMSIRSRSYKHRWKCTISAAVERETDAVVVRDGREEVRVPTVVQRAQDGWRDDVDHEIGLGKPRKSSEHSERFMAPESVHRYRWTSGR